MVLYKCPRCGFQNNIKTKMKNHYHRKKPCEAILQDISIPECLELLKGDSLKIPEKSWFCKDCCMSFNYKQVYQKHLQSSKHKNKTKDINVCEFCNETFSSHQSKCRHMTCCKYKRDISMYIFESKCIVCKKSLDALSYIEQCKHIDNHNITDENIKILRKSLDEKDKTYTHQTINCDYNIGSIHNNVVIFGNEDFSYITKNDIQEALKTKNVIPRLCGLMRKNPHHPENRNIRVTDFSRGRTQIFTENGWEPAQPTDTINNMIMEASDILDNKSHSNVLNDLEMEKVDSITDNVHELDLAIDKGEDTPWGKQNRREIMLEFV